ncbi:HNH endonuclease family protein [Aldersonia sp. NBC_00410]|uniref:HNH endonuclease family protein n=1 Tax=Aldersonia sp. NBC_00410 TaxID=2975954 RepID=UPI0022503915|nr:HNH endonuclease family protein [Aldersonia sp. NBC_00410]MCX5043615.1 HNH endonuclease family protein [Aldersonia sp. NBC_00410]
MLMWSSTMVAACLVAGCGLVGTDVTPAPGSPSRTQVEQLLTAVGVIAARPHPGGYQRGCGAGQACVFGPTWTDDTDAPGGHDGCDTRNDVLAVQLTAVTYRDGTRACVVVAGRLADPYTGRSVGFDKARAGDVQIDHVYPLAAAWDMGAGAWPVEQRRRFANDVAANLLAVTGSVNQSKGDRTPADWLPPNPAYHCFYAGKYLTVAVRYGLPVTAGDREALLRVAAGCDP